MMQKNLKFESNAEKISLIRKADETTALLFYAMFMASIVAYAYLVFQQGISVYSALPVISAPFFVLGAVYYVVNRKYYSIMFIAAASIVAFFILPNSVLFVLYLLVCTEGVAQMVEIVQRWIFYDVLRTVENVNVKKSMTMKDRVISFLFNIPVDLDTRNLTIDHSVSRYKLPWKDMAYTMMLALLFCMFLWIYVFLNPALSLNTEGVPIYTLTIVLYLSAFVMPWSIFNTMNARIATDYRDFKLYSGFLGTFQRMFLPVFAALLFLIAAVSSGPDSYIYVGMSLVMIVVMIVFTSVMYYTSNEMSVVGDILDMWDKFHPTSIYSGYGESEGWTADRTDVPGTPKRNPTDCFIPDVRNRR